jgi:hemerythrin-like domain-containing protein
MGGDAMSDPLARFEAEHREALAVLADLEQAATSLRRGTDRDALDRVRAAYAFLSTAVRRHNDDEERALFPLLGDEAPTGPFIEEHVRLRELERELAAALDDARPAAAVPPVAEELVALLRDHIRREDEALFPMARAHLERALRAHLTPPSPPPEPV